MTRFLVAAVTGAFLGIAILFFMVVATGAVAWLTREPASVPGVFRSWLGSTNGLPAVNFDPHASGMAIFVGAITVVYVAWRLRTSRGSEGPRTGRKV